MDHKIRIGIQPILPVITRLEILEVRNIIYHS